MTQKRHNKIIFFYFYVEKSLSNLSFINIVRNRNLKFVAYLERTSKITHGVKCYSSTPLVSRRNFSLDEDFNFWSVRFETQSYARIKSICFLKKAALFNLSILAVTYQIIAFLWIKWLIGFRESSNLRISIKNTNLRTLNGLYWLLAHEKHMIFLCRWRFFNYSG